MPLSAQPMKFRIPIALSLVVAALAVFQAARATQPNIIFILTDDLGPGDLGVLWQNARTGDQKFSTPHLDTFSAEGMRLTRHYCPAPVCAPSRASLLLGVHQGHANVRDNQFDKELEDNHTLGTVLKQAGYATATIGKWGLHGGASAPAHPLYRGFDYFFGFLEHGDAHRHYPTETGMNVYEDFTDVGTQLDKCYSTDLWTARAKDWIADQHAASPAQPFFLYLAYTAPHARLDVPTQAYPAGGGLTGGLQWNGIDTNPATPTINTATGTINSWIHPDYVSATYNGGTAWPDYAKRHATMVRRIDDSVDDLIHLLDDLGIGDDTLIVFSSDNGTHNEAGSGGSYTYNPTFFDTFGPYDGIKRDLWEGGVRMPTLVRWPAAIPANSVSNAASQFHDWLPTFCEVAGVPQPERSDGVSLVPTLTGVGTQRPGVVYSEYSVGGSTPNYSEFETSHRSATRNQMQFIHIGNYKGVRYNTQNAGSTFLVYDTVNDPKETTNLAGQPGVPTQQEFENRVLQVRRTGGGVTRPYDGTAVPASTGLPSLVTGLDYRAYEGSYPWVPDFETEAHVAGGDATAPDLSLRTRDDDFGLMFSGWIDIPTAGSWTFSLNTDTGAMVRLHDMQLIEADMGYSSGTTASSGAISLAAGKHPIRIHYRHGTTASRTLNLQWSGPGVALQSIPESAYYHEGVVPPSDPTANDDSGFVVSTGSSILIDVLENDSDPDGLPQPLSISAVGMAAHGSVSIESNQLRYTPTGSYVGPDQFSYTITDGQASDSAIVSLNVVAQQAPEAGDDTATTTGSTSGSGTPVSIAVLANDNDPDSGPSPLSIVSPGQARGGNAVISGSNILYTPAQGFFGTDTFTYTISDGAATANATVTVDITVGGPNSWYPFEETSGLTAFESGGGKPASLINFTNDPSQWVAGRAGNALAFDGADDFVTVNGNTGILGTNPRTVSAWIKTTGTGQHPVIAWGPNAAGQKWTFLVQGGNIRLEVTGGFVQGSTIINNGAWHHVAATWANDGTPDVLDVKLYVDGRLESSFTTTAPEPISTTASLDVRIGSDVQDRRFVGTIDDARIHTSALSSTEVAAMASETAEANDGSRWFYRNLGNAAPLLVDWNADLDGDGYSAFGEYALGGSPHWFDPKMAPFLDASAGSLDFIFNRRMALSPGRYAPEWSDDLLSPWTPLGGGSADAHPELPGFERVTVPVPTAGAPQRFIRLKVE